MKPVFLVSISAVASQNIFNDAPVCQSSGFDEDTDYHNGQGLGHAPATSAADCCSQCAEVTGCAYFTFSPADSTCWFKNSNDGKISKKGAISGGTAPSPPTPPPPPPGVIDALKKKYAAQQNSSCSKVLSDLPVISDSEKNSFLKAYQSGNETRSLSLASSILSSSALDAFLSRSDSFSAGGADSFLVQCAVMSQATPLGLAEFAATGQTQQDVVERLLNNTMLMRDMLVAGGAKDGKYGEAMSIYEKLLKASEVISAVGKPVASWDDRSQKSVLSRLALGTALGFATPLRHKWVKPGLAENVDPVERYMHYERAYLAGDLDPKFEVLTAFECRWMTDSDAFNEDFTWMRTTLPNYRPDHIVTTGAWRYSASVKTDVHYGGQTWVTQPPDYSQVPAAGGECGPRAFFGRFSRNAYGLPTWGVQQPGHAAMTTWEPSGWSVLLGSDWKFSSWEGRGGSDFQLETQVREWREDFQKVLRGQWVAEALVEEHIDETWTPDNPSRTGGLWSALMLCLKKATIQEKGAAPTRVIGKSEVDTKVDALIKRWSQTQPTPVITTGKDGTITIPAAAYTKQAKTMSIMTSADNGQQVLHNGGGAPGLEAFNNSIFEYEVVLKEAASYFLVANFTTWHSNQDILFTTKDSQEFEDLQAIPVFYTHGYWNETQPLEVTLNKGKNVLRFMRRSDYSIVLKELFLFKSAPIIPTPDPSDVPVPAPPPTPLDDYIMLSKGKSCVSQGIDDLEEKDCSIAAQYLGNKYTGPKQRDFNPGCFCLVSGEWAGNCNFNTNKSANQPNDDARSVCSRHEYSAVLSV